MHNKVIRQLIMCGVARISIIKTNNEYYKDCTNNSKIVKHRFFRKKLYINYIVYDEEIKWEVVEKLYLANVELTDFNKQVLVEVLDHIKDHIPFALS